MTVHYNFLAEQTYGADLSKQSQVTVQDQDCYARAILNIAAADGLSESEKEYFVNLARGMGMPDQFADKYASYDAKSETLEDILGSIKANPQNPIPILIYDAIKVSSVDGYTDKERAKVEKAAKILGLKAEHVRALEGVVASENAVRQTRLGLFAAMESDLKK